MQKKSDSLYFSCLDSSFGFLNVTGKDAARYLQGRISQDIKNLSLSETKSSLILSPQGRIEGKFLVIKEENNFLLLCDPSNSSENKEQLITAILKFKVSDAIEISDGSAEISLIALLGKTELINSILNFNDPPRKNYLNTAMFAGEKLPVIVEPSGLPLGCYLLCPILEASRIKAHLKNLGINEDLTKDIFHAQRIKQKLPLYGVDISEKIFATEIDYSEYISFKKGCYTGQEFVEMSIARGRPNKKLALLLVKGCTGSLTGEEIYIETNEGKSHAIGIVTSSCTEKDNNYLALAFIKSSTEADAKLLVKDYSAEILQTP